MRAASYLNAVHLLGKDSEKVIWEVTQEGWVPVSVAPLACRLSGAQDINPGGWEIKRAEG